MLCPFCRTENRDEHDTCYHCQKDLSMLRLVANKAKSHFNNALEYAERDRADEAIAELHHALDLDQSHINSHVVLGTLYAKKEELGRAEEHWLEALKIDPRLEKAHHYLEKLQSGKKNLPIVKRQRVLIVFLTLAVIGLLAPLYNHFFSPNPGLALFNQAMQAYNDQNYDRAHRLVDDKTGLDKTSAFHTALTQLGEIIEAEEKMNLESAGRWLDFRSGKDIEKARGLIGEILKRRPSSLIRAEAHVLLLQVIRTQLALQNYEEVFGNLQYLQSLDMTEDVKTTALKLRTEAENAHPVHLLDSARARLAADDLQNADGNIGELMALQPPPPEAIQTQAMEVRKQIVKTARGRVDDELEKLESSRSTEKAVRGAIELCRHIQPGPAGSAYAQDHEDFLKNSEAKLQKVLRDLARAELDSQIQRLQDRYRKNDLNEWDFLEGLLALGKENPDDEILPKIITGHGAKREAHWTEKIEKDLEAGRVDEARSSLDMLSKLAQLAFPGREAKLTALYEKKIREVRAAALLVNFQAAYKGDDLEKTVPLGAELLALAPDTLDETTRKTVETQLRKANENLAFRRWEWMLERDRKYEDGRIGIEDAKTTIAQYEQVAQNLSRKLYPSGRRDILLLYLAMSYRKVGQTDKAIQTFDLIRKDHPKSEIIHWVNKYHPKKPPGEKEGKEKKEN